MAKRRKYDPAVKAQVIAALLTGQGAEKVAEQYKIPVGTAKSWKAKAKGPGGVATLKKEEIGELLLGYLAVSLSTLKKQAEFFADETWLVAPQLTVVEPIEAENGAFCDHRPAKFAKFRGCN